MSNSTEISDGLVTGQTDTDISSAMDSNDQPILLEISEVMDQEDFSDLLSEQPPLPPPLEISPLPPPPSEPATGLKRQHEDIGPDMDGSQSDDDFDLDEIEGLLDKPSPVKNDKDVLEDEPIEIKRYAMKEKNYNVFDILPSGWCKVMHCSGLPVYLHIPTRVVSLSMPYSIGKCSVKKHQIPIFAIPCLNYRKALEKEAEGLDQILDGEQKNSSSKVVPVSENGELSHGEESSKKSSTHKCPHAAKKNSADVSKEPGEVSQLPKLPQGEVIKANDSMRRNLLRNTEIRSYCSNLFQFDVHVHKKFRSWATVRKRRRLELEENLQKRLELQKTSEEGRLPEGTQIITIPVIEMEHSSGNLNDPSKPNLLKSRIVRKSKKAWFINPAGKSFVCILHEMLQHSLKAAPEYKYTAVESTVNPYCATVEIGGVEYGKGYGPSKKAAKSDAARVALQIVVPEFDVSGVKDAKTTSKKDISFFDQIKIDDLRVTSLCNMMGEPAPYATLVYCLQKNFGIGDNQIKEEIHPTKWNTNEYKMQVNNIKAVVTCQNKRDGKQKAAQKLLQKLHPNIKFWGAMVRMYGSEAINAQKIIKQKESQVTRLQSRHMPKDAPNEPILEKLRQELLSVYAKKKGSPSVGKLTVKDPHPDKASQLDQLEEGEAVD